MTVRTLHLSGPHACACVSVRATHHSGTLNVNGNDALELYFRNGVLDRYGEPTVDGTSEPWECASYPPTQLAQSPALQI